MFIKLVILLALLYLIYIQLYVRNDIDILLTVFQEHKSRSTILYLTCAILLMPLNWMLESKKWQLLTERYQHFTFSNALKGVAAGVCIAIITPGRIGEYGGRLINIDKGHRSDAVVSTFVGSMAQNFVNIIIGFFCLIIFQSRYQWIELDMITYALLLAGIMIILLLIMLIYWRKVVSFLLNKLIGTQLGPWLQRADQAKQIENRTVTKVVGLSLLRYLVYSVQYIMMILYFGLSLDYIGSILGVGVIYLFQTMIPLPSFISIVARGEIAIQVWSVFTDNMLGIFAATFSLWIINLLIPALIGYIIIWKSNIK